MGMEMGMTDRQFDSYQARLIELLKYALVDIQQSAENANTEKLQRLISEVENELKRP
jgi:hypothetical protein